MIINYIKIIFLQDILKVWSHKRPALLVHPQPGFHRTRLKRSCLAIFFGFLVLFFFTYQDYDSIIQYMLIF
jgi:hypothetical protein